MHSSAKILLISCLISMIGVSVTVSEELRISRLFDLSNFSGTVPYSDVNLHVDRQHDEILAAVGNRVRVFNAAGMEIYRYDHDGGDGRIFDLAVDEAGDILLLTWSAPGTPDSDWSLIRCNYRGERSGNIEVGNLRQHFAVGPNRMFYREGNLMLVSKIELKAVVLDQEGDVQRAYDFAELLELEDPENNLIHGFNLDQQGNMLFTIPTQFQAYVVTPQGDVRHFGSAGSAPGKFGIVHGIAADDEGRIFVADRLRGVIMIFSQDLEFLTEFGAGSKRLHVVRPKELRMGNGGRLFVTQPRHLGIRVFDIDNAASGRPANIAGPIPENRTLSQGPDLSSRSGTPHS